MRKTIDIDDAKNHLALLVDRAAAGEEFVIVRNGKPVARLVGVAAPVSKEPRKPSNSMKITYIADDFDGPLSDELLRLFGSIE